MTIQKFLHSCLLIEEKGKKLLIDPGLFSFIENRISPKDIGPVDVILLTHEHADHYDPRALKELIELCGPTIIAHEEIGALLSKEGIGFQSIAAGDTLTIQGFEIQATNSPHGELPSHTPTNFGYFINQILFHPGDSYAHIPACTVLALPTFSPWGTVMQATACIDRIHPSIVIPIHDGFVKDFMIERIYSYIYKPFCDERKIDFHPLNLHESLYVPSATE